MKKPSNRRQRGDAAQAKAKEKQIKTSEERYAEAAKQEKKEKKGGK